jgi:hypothetical protein
LTTSFVLTCALPMLATRVTVSVDPTDLVVIGKVALDAPAGTVTS